MFLCIGFQKKYIVLHTYIHTVDGRRQKEKSVQRCFFSLSPTDNASSSTSSATTTAISYLLTLLVSEKPMRIRRNFASTAILSI